MLNIIINTICAAITSVTVALCGGPKWAAVGFGAIVFIVWTAYDLICAKINELKKP